MSFLAAGPAPVVFTLGSSAVLNPGRFYAESVDAARQIGSSRGNSGWGISVRACMPGRDILQLASMRHIRTSSQEPASSYTREASGRVPKPCVRVVRCWWCRLPMISPTTQPGSAGSASRGRWREIRIPRAGRRQRLGYCWLIPLIEPTRLALPELWKAKGGVRSACDALERANIA